MSLVKLIAGAALLAALSPQALAEVPAASGSQFVWVLSIEGRDHSGNTQLLFDDMRGALLPLDQLSHADRLINPQLVGVEGSYKELQLRLAPRVLTVSANGMQRSPLPTHLEQGVVLQGGIEVSRFEVRSHGLHLQPKSQGSLALLTR